MVDETRPYARRGWHVFPVHTPVDVLSDLKAKEEKVGLMDSQCSCGNVSCSSIGKHPRNLHGFNAATTDEATIRQWWSRWPDANIGIATGAVSGIVVLDVDPRHGGQQSLEQLFHEHLHDFPATVVSLTGGGGAHYFFAHPGQPVPSKPHIMPGLDIRGDGGYIVAPPSRHASGRRYAWDPAAHPDTMPLAPMPDWLRALVTAPATSPGAGPADAETSPRIPEGQRNDTLASLAGTMRRRGMTAEEIGIALVAVNTARCDPPLDEAEVYRIATSIGRYPPAATILPQGISAEPRSTEHLTDWGNAQRLVARHGRDLHYCAPWDKWLSWDSTRWVVDETEEVMRRAKDTVAQMYLEARALRDPDAAERMRKHAYGSESAPRLNAMIELAQSEPGIPILAGDLDTHHWLLNVQNGTLDLRTGELRAARRVDLITQQAPVTYDPEAPCPTWDAFLTRIMDGNQQLIRFLQRAVGYALTGDVSEQVMLILWGRGRNGKSTLLNTLMAMLGSYAMKATTELLMARKGDRHPSERADLCGKRFVSAIETGEGQRLDEVFVKEATGGDPIRARRMREDFWEFWPTHTIFMATNHKPVIRGTDEGIWRRIRLVPFTVVIPEEEQDTTVPEKLRAELPGILAWAVRGCLAWQQEGLPVPEEVQQATAGYREEMDTFGRFLADRCVLDQRWHATTEVLYDVYLGWCQANGEYQLSKNYFGMRLRERGLTPLRLGNARGWRGITLRSLAIEEGKNPAPHG